MANVPDLERHCNSWIIVDNGSPVIETWDRDYCERIASRALEGVVIYTAAQWLGQLNRREA